MYSNRSGMFLRYRQSQGPGGSLVRNRAGLQRRKNDKMTIEPGTYLSDMRPRFDPFVIDCGKIPAYSYQGSLRSELASNTLTSAEAIAILEDMLVIREFEEMIVKLRSGAYDPIRDYNYRGPTHVSVGQEGTAAGACSALLHLRQHHQHPPRPRREPGQGHGRLARDERRDASRARARLPRQQPRGAARGGARAACLPHDRRAVRQGRRLLSRARRLDAHRRLFRRPSRRQRHRRRRRADRHRRGLGQPLLRRRRRRVLLRRRRRLTPTASCSNR